MCREESEVQIIHRVLAGRWRASEQRFAIHMAPSDRHSAAKYENAARFCRI